MVYHKLYLNANLIKKSTAKANLFEIENHGVFGNFSFWFPKVLTKKYYKNGVSYVGLEVPETFIFHVNYTHIDKHNVNEIKNELKKEDALMFMTILSDFDDEVRELAKIKD